MPILQAIVEGKTIQHRTINGEWYDVSVSYLDHIATYHDDYRIKPNPKYRPFNNAEECWQEMQKHQPFGYVGSGGLYACILSVSNIDVSMANVSGVIITMSFEDLLEEDIMFADGTPFGVIVEE